MTKYVFLLDSPAQILEKNICHDIKNNPKKIWKCVNKRKGNVSIPELYKASTNKKVYCEADYAEAEASELEFNTWKIRGILNIQEKILPNSKHVISFDAATTLKKLNGLNKHK